LRLLCFAAVEFLPITADFGSVLAVRGEQPKCFERCFAAHLSDFDLYSELELGLGPASFAIATA